MLKKIARIGDFRTLISWSSPVEFSTVNIVYGVNGSGKSTLASLLQDIADPNGTASPDIRVEVSDSTGVNSTVTGRDQIFWPYVRVFNRAYVDKNFKFDRPNGSQASALMSLGERQIEAEARREEIAIRLRELDTELPLAQRLVTSLTTARTELLRATARQIGEELQGVTVRYSARGYMAPRIAEQLVDRASLQAGASTDVVADLAMIHLTTMPAVTVEVALPIDLSDEDQRLSDVLSSTVTSVVIPALETDPELAHWAQTGLHLHEGKDVCEFCGSPISEDRRRELNQHFDASLVALQQEIQQIDQRLTTCIDSAQQIVQNLPDPAAIFETERELYLEAIRAFEPQIVNYIHRAQQMKSALVEKASSMFSPVEAPPFTGLQALDGSAIVAALRRHNELEAELADSKSDAAGRIEKARILAVVERLDYNETETTAAQTIATAFSEEHTRLIQENAGLRTDSFDPQPLADALNQDLSELLGRDELRFNVNGDSYEILRSGDPADHLSEGEKTAISLLYFLSSLRSHDSDPEKLVVVIDDPVSSMDSSVLVGASSHLWSRLANADSCAQVILLTHNYELFQMWANLLERRKNPWKRDRPGSMFEMRMRAVATTAGPRRAPELAPWAAFGTPLQARIRSEYHYMFWRLGSTLTSTRNTPTPEGDMDAAALLPNVARRLLESFLSFKFPDLIGNFEGSVNKAMDQGVDAITQDRIVRFLHQQSHYENPDTGAALPRPESVTILTAVFDLMKVVDNAHFQAMCVALSLDPAQLTTSAS